MERFSLSRVTGPILIWLGVVLAGMLVGLFRGVDPGALGQAGVLLALPALFSLLLAPALDRRWAQAVLLLIWTGFAVFASLVGGLFPMALVFLAVPAAGMLFHRGRVVEALVLAVAAFAATWFAWSAVDLPGVLADPARTLFQWLGLLATLALVVGAMIAGTDGRRAVPALAPVTGGTRWRDGVSGGLFEFDKDGALLGANPEGRAQFGLDGVRGPITLDTLSDHEPARRRLAETVGLARRRGEPVDARLSLPAGDAHGAWLDARITPLQSGGLLLHTVDRTDEETRLEALRRSETVATQEAQDKTLFFAGVSHELRTPLNAIIGFSDMMQSRLFGPLPGKYAEYAGLIHESGQYMLDLIGDVLDLSKVEAGRYQLNPSGFDASDVVRSSVKMIRPSSDAAEVAVDIDLPGDDALLISADRKAVRQILLNLLSNAVKFSPKGSRVSVRARMEDGALHLSVADRGAGMSASELARIGEPWVQAASSRMTEARGSGLGLSLVRSLAELHGGRLEIDSAVGQGTTALVVIPDQDRD